MKIAFVVQRCGKEVFGGAEALTLQIGLNISEIFDIEILTTRAKEAGTWENYYPEGVEKIGRLVIRRFSVDKKRDPQFVPLSQYLELHNDDTKKGIEFINASGPVCNQLIHFIENHANDYDLFVFVGFLYWQTFYGLPKVKEKSLLLPTAHNEPWINFKIFEKVFELPRGYLFLTDSEKKFVHTKFGHKDKPFEIVGHGLDLDIASKDYESFNINLPKKYLLYVGRINTGKGCDLLSNFFNKYLETHNDDLKLIMIGSQEKAIRNKNILILENLNHEEKFFVIKNCTIFIMPSYYESLNIAILEAWLFKKPVLVNGESEVLKEHCLRGQGGLYFQNYDEFAGCLELLLQDELLCNKLGTNGEKYVLENYNWDLTRKKYKNFLEQILKKIKDN